MLQATWVRLRGRDLGSEARVAVTHSGALVFDPAVQDAGPTNCVGRCLHAGIAMSGSAGPIAAVIRPSAKKLAQDAAIVPRVLIFFIHAPFCGEATLSEKGSLRGAASSRTPFPPRISSDRARRARRSRRRAG